MLFLTNNSTNVFCNSHNISVNAVSLTYLCDINQDAFIIITNQKSLMKNYMQDDSNRSIEMKY